MQAFEDLRIKDGRKVAEAEAQLFFFFLFYFKLESKDLKNYLNLHRIFTVLLSK